MSSHTAPHRRIRFSIASSLLVAVASLVLLCICSEPCSALEVAAGPMQAYLFAEGKKHYDAGAPEQAAEVWRHVFPDTLYGPPAYLLLARGFSTQKPDRAEALLKELLAGRHSGVYHDLAQRELAIILWEQRKPEAAKALTDLLSKATDRERSELILRLAQLDKNLGDYPKAVAHYRTLYLNDPASVEGLKAADDLAWLVFHGKVGRQEFTETEQLTRADRLFSKGRFDLAADAYLEVLKKKPSDKALQIKIARCRFKERHNQKAIEMLKEILKGDLADKERWEALHLSSLVYWRLDREKDFEFCSARIIEKAPDKVKRKALFNLGAFHLERGRYAQAEACFNRVLKLAPEASQRTDVKWKIAWIKYWTKHYQDAADAFRDARAGSPGGKIDTASKYWQARSLALAGRQSEADALLKGIVESSPLNYYGIEAERLLRARNIQISHEKKLSKPFPGVQLSESEKANPHVVAANALMEQGLTEFALLQLEALPKSMKSSPSIAFLTAKTAYGAGKFRAAQDILYPFFGSFLETPPEDAPKEFIEMAFPRVHLAETTQAAQKHSMDPHLVWAIIRQESRYDPSVVSPAGAMGLMQVTPEAAGLTRKHGKIPTAALADLLEPSKNLAHGVRILAKNLDGFKGKLVPTVASYNADIRKVRDWIRKNGKMKQDEFIENIPYLETRIYVKKVLAGYQAYSLLHRKKDLTGLW
jgi:soluble lytic murein transglycosylase